MEALHQGAARAAALVIGVDHHPQHGAPVIEDRRAPAHQETEADDRTVVGDEHPQPVPAIGDPSQSEVDGGGDLGDRGRGHEPHASTSIGDRHPGPQQLVSQVGVTGLGPVDDAEGHGHRSPPPSRRSISAVRSMMAALVTIPRSRPAASTTGR